MFKHKIYVNRRRVEQKLASQYMAESRYGMIEKHSWPAKSHYIRYILSHVRAIAVDGAGLASAFLIAKLTMRQTL